MRISERLRVISDLIPDNSFILDVGCDHALLDIYTVLNKENVKAIASDISEGPLEFAKKNIEKYSVSDKIITFLGDGLAAYKKGVSVIVMSGLGSHTIVNILNNDKNILGDIETLIISSNNDYYFLRKSICDLGFFISDEKMVIDRDKYYPIVVFKKGYKKYNKYELKYGPILLKNVENDFVNYLKFNKKKLVRVYNNIRAKYIFKKLLLKKEIKYIDEILRKD